jgi:hypothetical protein
MPKKKKDERKVEWRHIGTLFPEPKDEEDSDSPPLPFQDSNPLMLLKKDSDEKVLADLTFPERQIWECDTNFKIFKDMMLDILNIDGVDIVRPLTPYSFWMCVGLLFDESSVKQNVQKRLLDVKVKQVETGGVGSSFLGSLQGAGLFEDPE